ncbi:MAG: hypothetical protein ABIO86_04135 [Sphingomonas sp.]
MRKLSLWENQNAVGRLIQKSPGKERQGYSYPASLTLHLGDYGTGAVVMLVIMKTFQVTSALDFTIVELPRAGMARVLTGWDGVDELRHLAADRAAAEAWLAQHHWSNARIDIVSEQDAIPAVVTMGRVA